MKTSFKETCKVLIVTSVILVGFISISPYFLFPDKGWYTPNIYARFDHINLSSLSDYLEGNNISANYHIDKGTGDYYHVDIGFLLPDNTTYVFSNNTYNISQTHVGIHDESSFSDRIWMNIRLDGALKKYRFPSEKDALNALYLLEPSFELIKYFLNESGNPMPYDVKYGVW